MNSNLDKNVFVLGLLLIMSIQFVKCNNVMTLNADSTENIKTIDSSECHFIDFAVSDDGDTIRPQIYQLKNNYQLLIRPVVCEGDNMYHICLKNGKNDSVVLEFDNPYINNSKYGPRYENVDFDNYFAITSFEGGYYVNLYEKKTGKRVLLAYEGMYDTEKQMLIYVTDDIENPSTILYDLNKNKKINLDDKINKNEEFGQVDYQRYFTIYKTTKDYIYIRYDASEKSYKFKVKR